MSEDPTDTCLNIRRNSAFVPAICMNSGRLKAVEKTRYFWHSCLKFNRSNYHEVFMGLPLYMSLFYQCIYLSLGD